MFFPATFRFPNVSSCNISSGSSGIEPLWGIAKLGSSRVGSGQSRDSFHMQHIVLISSVPGVHHIIYLQNNMFLIAAVVYFNIP